MKQLFFYELKQNITRDISKNIFMVKRLEKVFSLNTNIDRNLFQTCISTISNSFAIKNDKISHFENFNHVSLS